MTTTYPPLPNTIKALVAHIGGHVDLTPFHAGRAGTRLASGDTPAVRVTSLGGTQPWPWEARSEFAVEWWGGNEDSATNLARTGEAALYELLGRSIPGGRVTGVLITLSMSWQPDETTGRARYITHVQYTVSPEGS